MANTLKATPGNVGVWHQIMPLDKSKLKMVLCKHNSRGIVTCGILGDQKLIIHSLVNHPHVKGFSDHSNGDHLHEQLLSGLLFWKRTHFYPIASTEGKTETSTISTICLFAQYSQILFNGQKFIIISLNNLAYNHQLLNLLLCMLQ